MSKASSRIDVEVHERKEKGKNANRRVRASGMVPGNVYGLDLSPFPVSVNPRRVEEILGLERGRNTIFRLKLAGAEETRDVMLRELQRDPVSERLVHVDFVRVDPNKPVTISVPVHLEGTPEGVRNEGGVLDFVQRAVQISCLPDRIPEHLAVDVTDLHINQNVAIKDLTVDEGITILDDAESILAVVAITRAEVSAEEEAAEEAEGEEGAEPEVVGEEKEGEGEAQSEKDGD
jgi:large subunit ribosomal protein L25